MSQKDAERIQQHTGIDPEEMSDDELVQAMNELGIEQQEVTAADMGGQAAAPAAPAPPPSGGESDLDLLQKLGDLHAQGILTDEGVRGQEGGDPRPVGRRDPRSMEEED